VAAADQALYMAKAEGRNRCVVAGSGVATTVEPGPTWDPSLQRGSLRLEDGPRGLRLVPDPEAREPARAEHPTDPEELPRGSESILVVDDSEPARLAIARILVRLGYSVADAPDGESALEMVRSGSRYDLLVTDLLMPGMSGFTLADRVEREFGPQRVLYMSGEVQGEMSWGGAPGSRVAFLEKPMTATDLAARVRELLDLVPEASVAG
jgi:CheY-like chemotaxis protein